MKSYLGHPFWQTTIVIVTAFAVIRFGIPYLPPLIGLASAPVPSTVVFQYTVTVIVGLLVWASSNEERWQAFKGPIWSLLVRPEQRVLRGILLVLIPGLVAFITYDTVRPKFAAPPTLRSIHPAPPSQITFRGETMVLDRLENPLRAAGRTDEASATGKTVYYQNCMPCHGDYLDGLGHFATGFSPQPLPLRGGGTIAQLTESFVFWRIAKGGPGLPREGAPWNSAMPAWEEFLTADEIWAVIIFLYQQAGVSPRTWGEVVE
ncbi:MAG: cytochrome c [Gemmatimonadetes bacterium]|nr:cytochrome c [Gemmatimonadota bacterium]